jgi:hypothetical protein
MGSNPGRGGNEPSRPRSELFEPKQHNNVDEYDVAGILYPGKLDTDLITKCPDGRCAGRRNAAARLVKPLVGVDMWPVVGFPALHPSRRRSRDRRA